MDIKENLVMDSVILLGKNKENVSENIQDSQAPMVRIIKETAKKISNLNFTITECRIPIFAPLSKANTTSDIAQKFSKNKGIRDIETQWGRVFIRGRVLLTQIHRDILDCILLSAKKVSYSNIDGSIQVVFSARSVLRYCDKKGANINWLISMIEQIRDTTIKIKKDRIHFDFNILRRIVYSEELNSFYLEFDPTYIAFYQTEMTICHKNIIPILLRLESAVLKSMIRFLISHTNINISLENILVAIDYQIQQGQERKLQRIKQEILGHIGLLEEIGISYNKKTRIFAYKQKQIFISQPILSKDESWSNFKFLSKRTKTSRTETQDQPTLFNYADQEV